LDYNFYGAILTNQNVLITFSIEEFKTLSQPFSVFSLVSVYRCRRFTQNALKGTVKSAGRSRRLANTWLPLGNVIMGAGWQKTRDTKPPGIYWACQIPSTCTTTGWDDIHALWNGRNVPTCTHIVLSFTCTELHASAFPTI